MNVGELPGGETMKVDRCPACKTDAHVNDDGRWDLHFDPDPERFLCWMSGLMTRSGMDALIRACLIDAGLTITYSWPAAA
jgi:hypothetical protein